MRKSEILLTLALLGTASVAIWLWSELRAESTRDTELAANAASLPTPDSVTAATATPAPVSAPASPSTTAPAANFPAALSSREEHSVGEDREESQRRMLQETAYREAWRAQMRLNYARRRENVIRLLGFTPEEADAVVEIAIDRQLIWIDRPRQKPMTPEIAEQQRALYEQDRREDDAKLLGLLGEEKRARLQEYMDSRNTRVHVDQLRPQFTGEDSLRDDQVEPLIAALHVEHTRLRTEQQEYRTAISNEPQPARQYEREIELLEAAHDRMHSAAAPILSDSQLERFDTLLKRDFERQKLEMRMLGGAPDADDSDTE
jgi:hypothetical protein